jgi:carbonic anhydrase
MMIPHLAAAAAAAALYLASLPLASAQQYLDRFTYDVTTPNSAGFTDYGPSDWGDIDCDEINKLDECLAYRDKWHTGRQWDVLDNYCRSCPEDGTGTNYCGRHHQSPINLLRDRGLPGSDNEKECIDSHWMKYEDSFCRLDQLVDADAFSVERGSLRVTQPISVDPQTNEVDLECPNTGTGKRFGRIDYSKGFSQWWFLSHIDFSTPSEHTQEGKRYDAEAQMYHFYSVSAAEAGVANEMGTVTVFMNVYEDAAPYRYLDKLLCQWRRHEHEVRQQCGLHPIEEPYPGCFPNIRKRNLRREKLRVQKQNQKFQTVHDLIIHNARNAHLNKTTVKLNMDEINWAEPEDKDWGAWIAEQSQKLINEDSSYHHLKQVLANSTQELDAEYRKLIQGDEMEWFNYFLMLGVRTEYYYRYHGSQTIPPCYGNAQPDTRAETNHWRVLKDPIRIHKRQLEEMQRLLRARIAPKGSQVNECLPDTAAKVSSTGQVDVARPLQYHHDAHFEVFCECKDWGSRWPEDQDWCAITDYNERFYQKPYNFMTSGF